ncbi:MAG: hypothetical protein DHS20C21_23030 [Gemmatimonadota bacterium]|nr:MAG: hypothetical protein DHS20C21_23030 [Gemmatimonadota bacterium]
MRGVGPSQDMILGRAQDERIAHLGVAQGMSGSPVYVDGKLVGALSSSWSFTKEPLFGITPVHQMAEEANWGAVQAEPRSSLPFPHPGPGAESRAETPSERLRRGPSGARPRGDLSPDPGFSPISSPLVLSGFDRSLVRLTADLLEPWGFRVMEGGSGGGTQAGGEIEAGATLGVRLAGGDANMTAIGAVTWVDGDRVYGWGHPFFQMGDVEMPMVTGYIHTIVASQMLSFKLGSGGDLVGTVTNDRRSGISGRLGESPRLTQFDLRVNRNGESRDFHYEIIRHATLGPTLVGIVAANSVLAGAGTFGEETVRFTQRIVLDDGRDTVVETLISGDQTVAQVVDLLSQATSVIATNPFERVQVDRIEAELTYEPGIRVGSLTTLSLDDDTPRPGETVRGSYTIRDYRGEETRHRFAIPLPADAKEARYLLLVADSRTAEQFEAERAPRDYAPRTLNEFLDRIRRLKQTDEIHLHLYRQSDGVLIDGRPLADLPPSMLSVLRGAARSGSQEELPAELVADQRHNVGRFLQGGHSILFEVRKETP